MEWSPGNPAPLKSGSKTSKTPASLAEPTASLAEPPTSLADRRSEERFSAEGSVELRFEDPIVRTVDGILMDYSNSGFRANHQFHSLHTGQFVEFRHLFGAGKARVIWNRISSDGVETGFLVLQEQPGV